MALVPYRRPRQPRADQRQLQRYQAELQRQFENQIMRNIRLPNPVDVAKLALKATNAQANISKVMNSETKGLSFKPSEQYLADRAKTAGNKAALKALPAAAAQPAPKSAGKPAILGQAKSSSSSAMPKTGGVGVSTHVVPTSYQTSATVVPYYKPGKRKGGQFSASGMTSLGFVNLSTCNTGLNSTFAVNQIIANIPLDKTIWNGHQIGDNFESFQRVSWDWVKFHFIPNVGSTTAGKITFVSTPDAADVLNQTQTVSSNFICSHNKPVIHQLWDGGVSGIVNVNHAKLFTDYSLSTGSSLVQNVMGDPRLFTAGQLYVITGDGLANTLTAIGELFIEGGFTYSSPQRSDMSSFVYSVKAYALNNDMGIIPATAYDIPGSFIRALQIGSISGSPTYEYAYNPRFYNPYTSGKGLYTLPTGTYFMYAWLSCSASTTVSAAPTNSFSSTNLVYSLTSSFTQNSASGNMPEFSMPGVTGVSLTGAKPFVQMFVIKVTGAYLDGSTFTFQGVSNQNAGGNMLALHACCYRLPSCDDVPSAVFFPQGTSTFVSLNESKHVITLVVDDQPVRSITAPTEYVQQIKEHMFQSYLEQNDDCKASIYFKVERLTAPNEVDESPVCVVVSQEEPSGESVAVPKDLNATATSASLPMVGGPSHWTSIGSNINKFIRSGNTL